MSPNARRQFPVTVLLNSVASARGILEFPIHFLKIHYWYTRVTLIGINQTGVYLQALASVWPLFQTFAVLKPQGEQFEFWMSLCLTIVFTAWYGIPTLLSLRLIWPILVEWKRGLPAGTRRIAPSHRERSFLRSDFKPPWMWLAGVSFGCGDSDLECRLFLTSIP